MKIRKLLLTSLITFFGLASLAAQAPVHVYGTVYDANSGGEDSVYIQVSVFYADSTSCQSSTFTNVDGSYDVVMPCSQADTNVLGYVQVTMFDCNNQVQTQFFTAFGGVVDFPADFYYCQSNPMDSCIVFIYEEQNPGALNYLVAWAPPSQNATYLWSTGETTQDIHPVQAGTYCVTATLDPLGCTVSDCYYFSADSNFFCFAYIVSTPNNNNSYTLQAVGSGIAPFTYLWDNGFTSQYLQAVPPGTYCVEVTDATGCSYSTCIIVPDNNFCEAYISLDPNGGLTAYGYGLPPVVYLWSTGDTTQTIFPQQAGLYCVTITDANGCEASSCYDTSFGIDSCYAYVSAWVQDSNTLVLQAFSSGWGQSWTYLWSNGDTTDIIYPEDPFQSYCVTITDNVGCVASACYDPNIWCYAWVDLQFVDTTTAILTAMNDPIFNLPGSNTATYLWHTGETTQSITTDSSGNYCVTVTLGTGCVAEACIYVDFENLATDCSAWVYQYQDSSNQQWLAQVYSWGWGTFTYEWSTGDTTDIIQLNPNEFACVTVTSSLGCEAVACVDTFYNPCKPYISETYFSNNNILLTASGIYDPNQGATYAWNTGETTSSITVSVAGTYCVTVTGGGCVGSSCIDVVIWNTCGVTVSTMDTVGGTLFWANVWGTPPFTYNWDDGSTSSFIFDSAPDAEHCVTISDAAGCSSSACTFIDSCSAYITLYFNPNPTLQVMANLPISYVIWDTGNPGDTMLWLPITQAGTYCATVTTVAGCTSTTCITIDSLYPAQGDNVITGYVIGDTLASVSGRVHAYQMDSNTGNVFEEKAVVEIGQGGFYSINGLEPGVYLLKADFDANTVEDFLYIPSYHLSGTTWEDATPHSIPNFLTVTTDIKLVRKTPLNGGGVIGGLVTDPHGIVANEGAETRNLTGLSNVVVLLNDVYGQPLDYAITDETGNYKFENLPFGTYRLSFDIPGLTSPDVWVTLSANEPEKLGVTIVAENGASAVNEPTAEAIHLYPNPAKEQINMALPGSNAIYEIQVLDMQGRIVYAGSARNYNGILSIDVNQYSDGLYHINLINDDHRFYGRFIKQE